MVSAPSYRTRKSILPLVVVIILIAVLGYYIFGQEEHAMAKFRVYRPIYGSWGLEFSNVEIQRDSHLPAITDIQNKWEMWSFGFAKPVHIEMYMDGVKCNVLHGNAGLGDEISGVVYCPVGSGQHTVTVKLLDHSGAVKGEQSGTI